LPDQFGRYQILKQLGQGGMGAVYLAQDTQLDRPVALKVPFFSPEDGPEALERFYREAKAAAILSHPNLCPVHDVGQINGIHYLTMAYIEGKPLSMCIDRSMPLTQANVATVVRKLALALEEAHCRGVVHRDLKPSNIIINERGEPVITDFGLARLINREDIRLTKSGQILGTPAYMPPEQIKAQPQGMGPGCDVYSLGVILYEFLTGQLPFQGPLMAVLGQILTQQPEAPTRIRTDLDPRLEAICLRAMAKKVQERFASMREFAAALALNSTALRRTGNGSLKL
jgi:serine/threonine protein kinase